MDLAIEADALNRQRGVVWQLRRERLSRFLGRLVALPELSIFGCYDAGNVGDFALGRTVQGIASRHARCVLDSPGLSRRLTPPRAAVLAGGGVVTARPGSPVQAFSNYVERRQCAVAAIGVSGTLAESELPQGPLRTLQRAAWISARSMRSAEDLARALGRADIVVQPDIAFAMRLSSPTLQMPARQPRRLLLNVSPFLHSKRGDEFVANQTPSAWFSKHLPEQAAWYARIGPGYATMVQALAARFIAEGWQVVSLPLAPEDELFARSLLRGLAVEHLAFDSDPERALCHFATAERALVTRFHAHVFSILASTPLGSFAYSPKCSDLFQDLGLPAGAQAQPADWVHDYAPTLERLFAGESTAKLSDSALHELETAAYDMTRQGVLAALDRA